MTAVDETRHRVAVGDARALPLPDDSVDLVVTSPPYPMIELWDDAFAALSPSVSSALDEGDGPRAFELMHDVLAEAWAEVARVLRPGGIACVNVGDATRTLDTFRRYPNAAAVTEACRDVGLRSLPGVVWRKPTNSAAKFMGSGTMPPNAYVTMERERILVFRNGDLRRPPSDDRRESAYFWEERNRWFSDVWEVAGERQSLDGPDRERSAAFPFEIPYRLVNMFSVQGDVVCDPFLGTGTTTLAAAASARHSVGVDRKRSLAASLDDRIPDLPALARERNDERLAAHREFVAERREAGERPGYESAVYDLPVMTKAERELSLPSVESVESAGAGWRVGHGVHR